MSRSLNFSFMPSLPPPLSPLSLLLLQSIIIFIIFIIFNINCHTTSSLISDDIDVSVESCHLVDKTPAIDVSQRSSSSSSLLTNFLHHHHHRQKQKQQRSVNSESERKNKYENREIKAVSKWLMPSSNVTPSLSNDLDAINILNGRANKQSSNNNNSNNSKKTETKQHHHVTNIVNNGINTNRSDYIEQLNWPTIPSPAAANITGLGVNNRNGSYSPFVLMADVVASSSNVSIKRQELSYDNNNNNESDSFERPKRRAHLQEAPTFGQPIGNVTAVAGRDVRLICTVDNLGHYQVAWLKLESKTILSIDTNIITTNYRIFLIPDEEERKWVLHIKDVQESDRGFYQCQLNTIPMRSITGHLEVVVSPTIIESQSSQQLTVDEYSNVTLTCKTYAHPKASTTWKRDDGLPIKLNGALVQQQQQQQQLDLDNIHSQSINNNNNEASNEDDNDDYHMTAVTQPSNRLKAQVITQRNSLPVTGGSGSGDTTNYHEHGGAISAQTNWLRNNSNLPIVISSPIESQYKSEKLTLTNVSRTFTGVYICTSSNGIPPAATKKIPLFINFPPRTSLLNQYISANVGDTIELECIIEAYPKSSNHWARMPNGEDVSWTHVLGQSGDHGEIVEGTLLEGLQQQSPDNNNGSKNHIHISYHPHNRLNNRSPRDKVIRDDESLNSNPNNSRFPIVTTNTIVDSLDQTHASLAATDSKDERVYVSVKQNSVNSYTNQLKLTIPSLRRQDFGKYTCLARNNLGVSRSSVLIREITKTSEYLPQRPANMMQADYSEQQESIANQSKKLAINATHRNLIKHSGYSGNYYAEHPSATNKVYDEKYIQAIKARQLNLNTIQNYNSNLDKTVQRMKLKNAQNGSQLLARDTKWFVMLMVIVAMTLLLSGIM